MRSRRLRRPWWLSQTFARCGFYFPILPLCCLFSYPNPALVRVSRIVVAPLLHCCCIPRFTITWFIIPVAGSLLPCCTSLAVGEPYNNCLLQPCRMAAALLLLLCLGWSGVVIGACCLFVAYRGQYNLTTTSIQPQYNLISTSINLVSVICCCQPVIPVSLPAINRCIIKVNGCSTIGVKDKTMIDNEITLKKSKKRVFVSISECAFGKGYLVPVHLFYKARMTISGTHSCFVTMLIEIVE